MVSDGLWGLWMGCRGGIFGEHWQSLIYAHCIFTKEPGYDNGVHVYCTPSRECWAAQWISWWEFEYKLVVHFLTFGCSHSGFSRVAAKPVLYWGCSQNPAANEIRAPLSLHSCQVSREGACRVRTLISRSHITLDWGPYCALEVIICTFLL